jgi:hypothetical protein
MHIDILRPRWATLLVWPLIFLIMPSFFYSQMICGVFQLDISTCGWQFSFFLSGAASLESLQAHTACRLGSFYCTQGDVFQVIVGIGVNLVISYVLAAMIISGVRPRPMH